MSVKCYHLLPPVLGALYASCLCHLPLTKYCLLFGNFLSFFLSFSFLFCPEFRDALQDKTVQYKNAPKLFVCLCVLTECINTDKTSCAAHQILFYLSFTHFLDTRACEKLADSGFCLTETVRLSDCQTVLGLSIRKRLCLKAIRDDP